MEICRQLELEKVRLETVKLYNEMNSFINENIVELDYDSELYTEDTDNKDKAWYEKVWDWIRGVFQKIGDFFKNLFKKKEETKEEEKEEAKDASDLSRDLEEDKAEIDENAVTDEEALEVLAEQVQLGIIDNQEAQQIEAEIKTKNPQKKKISLKRIFVKGIRAYKNLNPFTGVWEKNPQNFIYVLYFKQYCCGGIIAYIDDCFKLEYLNNFKTKPKLDSNGNPQFNSKGDLECSSSYRENLNASLSFDSNEKKAFFNFCNKIEQLKFDNINSIIELLNQKEYLYENLFKIFDDKKIAQITDNLRVRGIPNLMPILRNSHPDLNSDVFTNIDLDSKDLDNLKKDIYLGKYEFELYIDKYYWNSAFDFYNKAEVENLYKNKYTNLFTGFCKLLINIGKDNAFRETKKAKLKNSRFFESLFKAMKTNEAVKKFAGIYKK